MFKKTLALIKHTLWNIKGREFAHEALGSSPTTALTRVVVHTPNTVTLSVEAGGSEEVQSYPRLNSKFQMSLCYTGHLI